ncbi:MAG TPA: hypothetical protein VN688_11575 [Gemmataceae bacterium]|nr:hypothetical protein [Gemmataceae bacterium]
MTRSAARRPGAVQAEKSLPPSRPDSDAQGDEPTASPERAPGVAWYWQLVMFLWVVSFASLLAYEWLSGLFKLW